MAEDFDQDFEQDWFEEKERKSLKSKFPKSGIIALVIGVLIFIVVVGGFFTGTPSVVTGNTAYIVLNDKRCSDCNTTMLEQSLSQLFPGDVKEVDYNTPEGKKLYNDLGLTYLPAVLFTKDVKKSDSYSKVENYLEQKGDYLSLRIGASFDPTAEICDNGVDDTGNGKVDCADPTCSDKLVCREEMKGRLDVFVMSHCPYGTAGLDAMKEVLDAFGNNIDFHVNYIASENSDGTFSSLHGQKEVDDDIRELCVMKYYPDNYKYMDFIWCRNKDLNADWEKCVTDTGMDLNTIKSCAEGDEGKSLLSDNIKIAKGLGIGASPTWLANNRYQFGGIDAETIKQGFCAHNSDLTGCGGTLSSGATPSGSCG